MILVSVKKKNLNYIPAKKKIIWQRSLVPLFCWYDMVLATWRWRV